MTTYHMQDLQPQLRRRADLRAMHRENLKGAVRITFWGVYAIACLGLWKYIYTHAHLFGG